MPGETSSQRTFANRSRNFHVPHSIENTCAFLWQRSRNNKTPNRHSIAFFKYAVLFFIVFLPTQASANFVENITKSLPQPDILMLAAFGGAMSFALLSASWMIRERKRIIGENNTLREGLSKLRAISDRNEALVAIAGQRTLVWNAPNEAPSILGKFVDVKSAPSSASEFVNFENWLMEEYAETLAPLANALRNNAESFDEIIETRDGCVLEAKGRTSGACAYIRFSELGGEKREFAELKTKNQKTLLKFRLIEALFSKTPMPVWMKEPDGKLSWVNAAYADALELKTPRAVIETQTELFDQEQRTAIKEGASKDELFKQVLPATVAGDRKMLEVYNIETNAGFMGLAFDQSNAEDIRATLNETIEGHSKMLDQLATAVAIFDNSQKLVFHNSGFQNLWKLDPSLLENAPSNSEVLDAIRDQNILPLNPDWKKWRDSHLEIYTAIEPVEEWWHLLDGQTLRVIITPRNEGGATWVFENVTEKLALESNLKSVMRIQGETLDHLIEAVAVFGSDGNLKLFNPALKNIWENEKIEVDEGVHIARVIEAWSDAISNEEDLAKILGKITGFDDTRETVSGRLELRNDTAFQYSVVPLPEGQSMLTLTDITASVNFERALQDRAEALEESDKLKNKFIQHVSYELRAPLTSISGFGEMLSSAEMGELNSKQGEYLDHINEAADVLKRIVDDIIDLASVDAGTMVLDHETVNLKTNIESVISSFASAVDEKQIKFESNVDRSSTSVIADEKRLTQILENLVSNAVTFSPDGGTVQIEAKLSNATHEIRVIDQGPGIPEGRDQQIFDRFETSSQDGSRLGPGLGLSIVRSFAQLHGGSVRTEKTKNGGACFVFTLPVEPVNYVSNEEKIA